MTSTHTQRQIVNGTQEESLTDDGSGRKSSTLLLHMRPHWLEEEAGGLEVRQEKRFSSQSHCCCPEGSVSAQCRLSGHFCTKNISKNRQRHHLTGRGRLRVVQNVELLTLDRSVSVLPASELGSCNIKNPRKCLLTLWNWTLLISAIDRHGNDSTVQTSTCTHIGLVSASDSSCFCFNGVIDACV